MTEQLIKLKTLSTNNSSKEMNTDKIIIIMHVS